MIEYLPYAPLLIIYGLANFHYITKRLKKLYYKPKKQKLDEFLDNFEEAPF